MRALMFGDSHGTLPMVREASRAAAQLGATWLWSAGDFNVWPGHKGKEFLDAVEASIASRDQFLLLTPGNHEDYDQLEQLPVDDRGRIVVREHIRALPRGHVEQLGDLRVLSCGGAPSIDGPGGPWVEKPDGEKVRTCQSRGPLDVEQVVQTPYGPVLRPAGYDLGAWWPQERITDDDVAACAAAGPVDVLVTHEVPTELPLQSPKHGWDVGDEQRSKVSRIRAAARPALHVAGHYHTHARYDDATGRVVVLSADVEPSQVQWALLDDEAGRPRLRWVPQWSSAAALTRFRGRALVRKHRVVSDLSDRDLHEPAF